MNNGKEERIIKRLIKKKFKKQDGRFIYYYFPKVEKKAEDA